MSANASPVIRQRFFDNNGLPLNGGLINTYLAGTTTPLATYTDETGGTPNANPVVCDSYGYCDIWLAPGKSYKFVVTDSASNSLWTKDNVTNEVLQDLNGNITANAFIPGYTSAATAAGTTTLTVASTQLQTFTGTTTQSVVMPVVTTLANGMSWVITNNSTGVVTVKSSGANTIQAMAANSQLIVTCINPAGGTGTASWNWVYNPNPTGGVLPISLGGTNNGSLAVTSGGLLYTDGAKVTNLGAGTSSQTVLGGTPPTWGVTPGITNNYYSGYMPNATTWATTSTSMAAMAVTGVNTLTKVFGNGITVTAAASNAPGITWTPSASTSVYWIVATTGYESASVPQGLELTDGTFVIQGAATNMSLNDTTMVLSGIYAPGTGSSVTVQIYGYTSNAGDSVTIGMAGTIVPSIQWSLVQIK